MDKPAQVQKNKNALTIGLVVFFAVVLVVAAVLLVVFLAFPSSASSSSKPIIDGNVIFAVKNSTDANASKKIKNFGATTLETPTYLGIKLLAVYIVEDVDPNTQNNIGTTSLIYLNPQCEGNIAQCNPGGPYQFIVTEFFDFALPTNEVNAILNSQAVTVPPGTYKYVRMEFCKEGTFGANNFSFQTPSMTSKAEFARSSCAITQLSNPPLVVTDTSKVTIQVDYDLTDSVSATPGGSQTNDTCVTQNGIQYCLTIPNFIPSAIVS